MEELTMSVGLVIGNGRDDQAMRRFHVYHVTASGDE